MKRAQVVKAEPSANNKKTKMVESKKKNESDVNRVLALSMRPSELSDLIGQDKLIQSLAKQMSSGRIPHFFIISGPVGAGKTTLAKIISKRFMETADVKEINAANQNGVDDIRELVDKMRYRPVYPHKSKVVILDEAHQLTIPAQNTLITETEDVADYVYYIFCTSNIRKIIPALQRRAFIITPHPLNDDHVNALVDKAVKVANCNIVVNDLKNALKDAQVTSPGLVLQAIERFLSGLSASQSVLFTEDTNVNTLQFCRLLSSGNWSGCCELLKDAGKSDVPTLRNCALGYMKSILLKTQGSKALHISRAIQHLSIDSIRTDEGASFPLFLSSICLACDALKPVLK